MKRVLKFILSFILIAAICVAGWYFIGYRMLMNRQFMVAQAESLLADNRISTGLMCYEYAWNLNPNHPDTAVGLANAYITDDNYTKAEYTLVSAITAHPDVLELYLELSKVYVAQDKLLDAEQMLSRVTNESIQTQLTALRPAAPTISPDSGYYEDIIEVALSYDGGTAYMTIDGRYPSLNGDVYTAPMELPTEASTANAIVVSDDGLVSTLSTSGYTIGGIVEPVTFQDPVVEETIRTLLNLGEGTEVLTSHMWSLAQLELPSNITTLDDLVICKNLTSLTIHEVYGIDFSMLANLQSLKTLNLNNTTVSTKGLVAISTLPNLTTLHLSNSGLTDISALAGATTLTALNLSGNAISDVAALSSLVNITELNLSGNQIANIDPLASMTQLTVLDISSNAIATLNSLNSKVHLTHLLMSSNQIVSIADLSSSVNLTYLVANHNNISDLSPLVSMTQLTNLDLSYNQITELPDFSGLTKLNNVLLSYNEIQSIDTFAGLPLLNYLTLDYNNVSDLSALGSCSALVEINAFANPITEDITPLLEKSIIVNYDPTYAETIEETEDEII
ncbi:MAG: leucine-rich repeat protein [Eubacteriales bacterium]